MPQERRNTRIIEISTGLLLILSVLTMLVAVLLGVDYTLPNATFSEDIDFLKDSVSRQQVSAISWLVAAGISLVFQPVYLMMFHRFQLGVHVVNSLFILVMAFFFFRLGISGLHIAGITSQLIGPDVEMSDAFTTEILMSIRQVNLFLKLGLTAFGAFATTFTVARFSEVKFPVFGSTLTFLAAPVVVTFSWLNPDHILMTSSLAVAWTGLLIIGARFVTLGLKDKELPGAPRDNN
jgi:hypothetical protein